MSACDPGRFAGASESARPARSVVELIDLENRGFFDSLNDELGDSVAAVDLKGFLTVGIDDYHLYLTAITRVYEAGRVYQRNSVARRQPASWQDESREP